MAWHARLSLDYDRDGARTIIRHRHDGPLRVLRSLYPEGPGICHTVLVHSPGGLVGGDRLDVEIDARGAAHVLVTTPGASRFYRSAGEAAAQFARLRLHDEARLEWLPLESICHSGALAETRLQFELASGAEMIGWEVLALGLPASGAGFDAGRVTQHIERAGVWLERGTIDAHDRSLLDSPLGWAGDRVLATLWIACGSAFAPARRDTLLEAARELAGAHPLAARTGCTAVQGNVIVLRALAPRVEPARSLLSAVWQRWRQLAWQLPGCPPRVWRT